MVGRSQLSEIVLLHFLGGSARSWAGVQRCLHPPSLALDLPGFGDASGEPAGSVAELAEAVAAQIPAGSRPVLVGHSMGAKMAMVVARQRAVAGLVLIAGSPPSPEPMEDAQRALMLQRFSSGRRDQDLAEARAYIDENCDDRLAAELRDQAVLDVLRMNGGAWRAWLEIGSREDWSERIGMLSVPALVIAGGRDKALGLDTQRRLMAPHFGRMQTYTLETAGHLMPLEQPEVIARLIEAHAAACF